MVHLEPILVPIERRTGLKRSPSRHLIAEHFQSDKRFVIKTFYASAFYFFFYFLLTQANMDCQEILLIVTNVKLNSYNNSTKIV